MRITLDLPEKLVVAKKTSRIFYPLNPSRKAQLKDRWWHDVPRRVQGAHDGMPDRPLVAPLESP